MSKIKLYTDEDMFGQVAPQLRRRTYDVLSTPEAGNLGLSDNQQLEFAISQGRTILTFNIDDFPRMHYECLATGRNHYGIIVSAQVHIGAVVKRCLNLMSVLSAEEMVNRLEYLSNWQ
ncbi:TPA: hypothetical protein EYP66_08110 [Candidatus Poribacteria bacterium]|nr:hypothetical protein [Candidatus Poribacteria bacterium]